MSRPRLLLVADWVFERELEVRAHAAPRIRLGIRLPWEENSKTFR